MPSVVPTSSAPHSPADFRSHPPEFERLWRAFMTARVTLGLVLVVLQAGVYLLVPQHGSALLWISAIYFASALGVRVFTSPRKMVRTFDAQWLRTVGVDVLVFTALQWVQEGAINYTPLFALPVLMVSILGPILLALATAASVTLLMFAYATWQAVTDGFELSAQFLQVAFTGSGFFLMSFLASQLAGRLASTELRAQRSQLAATVQRQVNELVIRSLSDGIVVVDERGIVRSANPAAIALLEIDPKAAAGELDLRSRSQWEELLGVISDSFVAQSPLQTDIDIPLPGNRSRQLRLRTQLTSVHDEPGLRLCVVFLRDQREIQARIREEKLASMGRMSAAVAHEIRNPLAAITQANALLAEELPLPGQQRLADMVRVNALRLENIVRDVLHLAQVGASPGEDRGQTLDLVAHTQRVCRDWSAQHSPQACLRVLAGPQPLPVWFDPEHLRRVLVNLLDNARRYASQRPDSVCITVASATGETTAAARLCVWSDGSPLDASVEDHLFEPFFSSESRSSGLGLYICRELCESHGASISYDRVERTDPPPRAWGNAFTVMFKSAPPATEPSPVVQAS